MRIAVTDVDEAFEPAVDALLAEEPDLEYANFAPVAARPGAATELHRRRFRAPGALLRLVAHVGDRALAALRVDPRPFESEHFDLHMSRIDRPLGVREDSLRTPAFSALYGEAQRRLQALDVAHVSVRASTRDRSLPWVLQELGAVHVDTQVSWMCALSGTPHDDALPAPLSFECHSPPTLQTLPAATWKRLAEWGGLAFDRGPLVFDHTLPRERAMQVYEAWTEKVMSGEWADAVVLVRHRDEVVAFISMLELSDVSRAAGELVCGRGLGATLPEYRGLFTAIQREMIAIRPLGAAFMENETQVATIGSVNVYAKLGFRYLRSTSTFHWRLDGASRCA